MVFRVAHPRRWLCFSAVVLTVLFCFPYLCRDFLALEHDTLFHLSRIQGLAEAIHRGDLLPALYPYKNNGFGYASPLFYCDLFLTPAALLYLAGVPLSWCYVLNILAVTFFSIWAMSDLLYDITEAVPVSILCAAAFAFANYRITDVYVRGALGEVTAMIFLILLLKALWILLEKQNPSGWKWLWAAFCGLLCSHNLTALLGGVLFLIIWLVYAAKTSRAVHLACLKALVLAALATAWFTIPMLEQLHSQSFLLNYYASSSDLAAGALPLWKYLANTTVFGYGTVNLPRNLQMTVNPGWFLMAAPLSWFLIPAQKRLENRFCLLTLALGYIACLLPWDIFPWQYMSGLRILQFPWRLMTLAIVLLPLPAAAGIRHVSGTRTWIPVLIAAAVLAEGFMHVLPAASRTFGIDSSTGYEDLLSGELIDPYYSAHYVRVELAGGEYLPSASPDFRQLDPVIKDRSGRDLHIPYEKDGTTLRFQADTVPEDAVLILPLTWYRGYVLIDESGKVTALNPSSEALVQIEDIQPGTFTVQYRETPLRQACRLLSLAGLIAAVWFLKQN